jgi:hypothetical protein
MSHTTTRLGWMAALAVAASTLIGVPPAHADYGDVTELSPAGHEVFPGAKATSLMFEAYPTSNEANAVVTIRKSGGRVVRTMPVEPVCIPSCEFNGDLDAYVIEWGGRNNAGVMQEAGRYVGHLTLGADPQHRATYPLGSVWIDHLVTRSSTADQKALPDPDLASISTIGDCSSVAGPKEGTPWNLRLLSLSRCDSTEGMDDWAFSAEHLSYSTGTRAQRLVSVTVGADGSPAHAGDVARIVVDSSGGTANQPTWKRVLVMPPSGGTHMGETFTVPVGSQIASPYDLLVQARTLEGDKYRLTHYRTTWTYRAWSR